MSFSSAIRLSLFATILAIFGFSAQAASAANLYVDDNGQQCPAATFTSVQAAVNAAVMGDTVVVCDGTYSEGSGAIGTSALVIDKSISIRGAGADKVTIQPTRTSPSGGQIAATSPVLRDGVGNIVSVNGTPEAPLTVNISGVTISGGGDKTYFDPNANPPIWNGEFQNGVYSEAGLVFLDAGGSFNNGRITNVVVSETAAAESVPGGYRNGTLGWALAQITAATAAPSASSIPLEIKGSRFDRYNRGGILIDGATNDVAPFTASGNPQEATVLRSTVVGRQLNSPPLDGSGGGALLTSGSEFGQDGVRVTSGSALALNASDVFQNLPAGAGTNVIGKLNIASGLRFIDAAASSATKSNILQNGYGIINVQADGTTANTAVPVTATNNWWGLGQTTGIVNNGPGVSPGTLPTKPNNPVNGSTDVTYGSTAVHFLPFRSGNEADTNGIWPTAETPAPTTDAAPTVSLSSNLAKVSPGGQITLTANAVDDFGVKKITFFEGTTQIGTVTPPSNSVTWSAPNTCGNPRTVTFTAYATDSEGQESLGQTTVDVDDCAPTVTASAVANDGGPLGSFTVNANASDDLGLASLKFYIDGDLTTQVNNPPNGVTSRNFTPGDACGNSFAIEVVATDTTGHETSSSTTFDQTDCIPTVSLSVDSTTVAPGASIDLDAVAEDDNLVDSLEYFAGATSVATATNTGSANPWSHTEQWTAPNQCGTSTVLKVEATDDADQVGTSNTVTVSTTACPDNPPTVSLAANPTSVDPGGQVTLTATATDDDEVTSLVFFQGTTQIGSVTPPNNSITWTAPEACNESYTLRVVATDSASQTAEDTVTVTTKECPVPAEPGVSIMSPTATIAQNGTTFTAIAASGASVTKVTFYLGTRQVCEDSTSPYSCAIVPNGSEIGSSSVRAVVTDSLGRTAEDTKAVTVSKFKPKSLTAATKRIGAKRVRMKVFGKLVMPARMTAAQGCKASRVDIKARLGKKSLTNKQVKLAANCSYGLVFGAPKTKKNQRVVITVRFPGNTKLTATSAIRKVR